jgi:peptide deformylase
MYIHKLSVALMAAALLTAAPGFAQTTPQKQKTQEGGLSVPAAPPSGYKQPTQEGGLSVPAAPSTSMKQPTQEGGLSVPAASTPGIGTNKQN